MNIQINKVIYEDLVLAAEFRKPEQLKRFYISLLERPGREVNLTQISSEIGINHAQVEKYLPLLEMTDLVSHIGKFRNSALRVRRGNVKFYLVDLALRNAVLRIPEVGLPDESTMGLYAENLVFNALKKWRGALAIDYYRERDEEVDFIVHIRPNLCWPCEVKHCETILNRDLNAISKFQKKQNSTSGIVVTKNREQFGPIENYSLFYLPLILFLLMFD